MSNKALLASKNKIKAYAAEDALGIFSGRFFTVEHSTEKVDSRVSKQPMSLAETTEGALSRLAQIRKAAGYTFYIAIEGGVYGVESKDGKERWYESACAAVSDEDPRSIASVAYGPAYPIPDQIALHLFKGKDLNEAMELETGIPNIGNSEGFNGWLTEDKLNRQAASTQAVLLALYGLKHMKNFND